MSQFFTSIPTCLLLFSLLLVGKQLIWQGATLEVTDFAAEAWRTVNFLVPSPCKWDRSPWTSSSSRSSPLGSWAWTRMGPICTAKGRPVALPLGDAKSESLSTHHLPRAGTSMKPPLLGRRMQVRIFNSFGFQSIFLGTILQTVMEKSSK